MQPRRHQSDHSRRLRWRIMGLNALRKESPLFERRARRNSYRIALAWMLITAVLLRLTTFDAATTAAYVCMFTALIPVLVTATFARVRTRTDLAAFLRRLVARLPALSALVNGAPPMATVIAVADTARQAEHDARSRADGINACRRSVLHGAPHFAAHRAHFAATLSTLATS